MLNFEKKYLKYKFKYKKLQNNIINTGGAANTIIEHEYTVKYGLSGDELGKFKITEELSYELPNLYNKELIDYIHGNGLCPIMRNLFNKILDVTESVNLSLDDFNIIQIMLKRIMVQKNEQDLVSLYHIIVGYIMLLCCNYTIDNYIIRISLNKDKLEKIEILLLDISSNKLFENLINEYIWYLVPENVNEIEKNKAMGVIRNMLYKKISPVLNVTPQ